MSIRRWFRERMGQDEARAGDPPPGTALVDAVLGPPAERSSWLGDCTSETYPHELREMLLRRQEVTRQLVEPDLTTPAARIAAIPRLRELLSRYPHPLVYDALINAYI